MFYVDCDTKNQKKNKVAHCHHFLSTYCIHSQQLQVQKCDEQRRTHMEVEESTLKVDIVYIQVCGLRCVLEITMQESHTNM
jgi:hypothetical protein